MAPLTNKNATSETKKLINNDQVFSVRTRFTIAQINAGATLLPALPKHKYTIVDMALTAIGGAVAAATDVRILGTQAAASVALLITVIAALTQNKLVRAGDRDPVTPFSEQALVLAGGLSFVANDANTAITVGMTGSAATTATHVDVMVTYVVDNA